MADDNHSELGYGALTRTNRLVKKSPELRWPMNQYLYAAMKKSSKVSQVVAAITQPLERANWSIKGNGAPDEITEHIASDLRLPVHGREDVSSVGKVSWKEHLGRAVDAVFYGVAFFEQVYEVREDGKEHLRKLAHRHNTTISKIHVADDGGLEGITQKNSDVFIPVDRLVVYVFRPEDTSWTGESILEPAYPHWAEARKLENLNSVVIQRNSLGVPIHKQSLHTAEEDMEEAAEAGLQMATTFAAGEAAGGTLRPGEELELKGVSGTLIDILPSIRHHEDQIAIAVNATHLNLQGQGGSYALAETKTSEFVQQVQSIADWIASNATQHIVQDLVRVAYPEYEGPIPSMVMTPVTAKKEIAPGDLSQLANAGVLLTEPNLEGWVRQNYEIPQARSMFEALSDRKKLEEAEADLGVTVRDPEEGEA